MQENLPKDNVLERSVAKAASAVANAVTPGTGLLLDVILKPVLERKVTRWRQDVEARLIAMEGRLNNFRLSDLEGNETFAATALRLTLAATTALEQQKLDFLRNALLNSALGRHPGENRQQMLLTILDQVGAWHVLVLDFLHDPRRFVDDHVTSQMHNREELLVRDVLPELQDRPEVVQKIVDDLVSDGLISQTSGPHTAKNRVELMSVTQLGHELLELVREPRESLPFN